LFTIIILSLIDFQCIHEKEIKIQTILKAKESGFYFSIQAVFSDKLKM